MTGLEERHNCCPADTVNRVQRKVVEGKRLICAGLTLDVQWLRAFVYQAKGGGL